MEDRNMQVSANWELPVYQVLGPIIRVHWDYHQRAPEPDTRDDMDGGQSGPTWVMQEAVVPLDADRATFVRIVTEAGGPGKKLADGWFQSPLPDDA
jgi:hypothetical protein